MDECQLWQGSVAKKGYGTIGPKFAHRVAWEKVNGVLAPGLVLHHICGVKLCVNPAHLKPMTQSEHMKEHGFGGDRLVGNGQRTHCRHGHAYDEANTYIEPDGSRGCKACKSATSRRYYQRKVAKIGHREN